MKQWNAPEMNEMNINGTEYMAFSGKQVDGQYLSDDGKYQFPTYSGGYAGDLPVFEAK